jgi:hypothetical protein
VAEDSARERLEPGGVRDFLSRFPHFEPRQWQRLPHIALVYVPSVLQVVPFARLSMLEKTDPKNQIF